MSWMVKVDNTTKELGPLKNWSFSGLKTYEQCPFRRSLQKIGGHKEPSGPAAERGSKIHDGIEKFIKGEIDSLPKLKPLVTKFITAQRTAYINGKIHLEENWCIDKEWNTVDFADRWGIFIIDYYIIESLTSAKIIDWKSGKSFGNEMKHAEQLLFYTCSAFARYPKLEYVTVAACYVDEDKFGLERGFTRAQIKPLRDMLTKRALIMTTAQNFPPSPSKSNCKWCKFKEMKDANDKYLCEWGVL